MRRLLELKPLQQAIQDNQLALFEHYYDRPEIDQVTFDEHGPLWHPVARGGAVANAFEQHLW